MDCIFCRITNHEIPTDFIYEDESVAVFKDIKPSAPIHCLIVPKEHVQSIIYLQDNHEKIISKMIFTAKMIAEKLGLEGYKLVFNVGRQGGQMVDHLHLHLLGGWENNPGKLNI